MHDTVGTTKPDYVAIKIRQQASRPSSDFGHVGTWLQIVAEMLCGALDLRQQCGSQS